MNQAIDKRPDSTPLEAPEGLVERAGPLLVIAATIFALDQGSKSLIRHWLSEGEYWPANVELIRLSHYENTGAAFGILQGAGPLFVIATLAAIVVISFTIFRENSYPHRFTFALALVLGGAVGNLADRLGRGSVTDFIDPTHYPAFNIADSAIVIGVASLLILSFFDHDDGPTVAPSQDQIGGAAE